MVTVLSPAEMDALYDRYVDELQNFPAYLAEYLESLIARSAQP